MPRSASPRLPKVMNVEAGFGAVFSETGGGGGGFDRLSSVRSIDSCAFDRIHLGLARGERRLLARHSSRRRLGLAGLEELPRLI